MSRTIILEGKAYQHLRRIAKSQGKTEEDILHEALKQLDTQGIVEIVDHKQSESKPRYKKGQVGFIHEKLKKHKPKLNGKSKQVNEMIEGFRNNFSFQNHIS